MVTDRVRFEPLQDKICNQAKAAQYIQDGTNLNIFGFTAGYPKLIPPSLPWQAGVSDVANAVLSGFIDDTNFHFIDIYSEFGGLQGQHTRPQ